jgi:hypothetical protein
MTALAPIAPKIAKLIPLLSSDKDGEVLAATRAIERTLKSAGLDLHALAAAIGDPPPVPPEILPTTQAEIAAWCVRHDNGFFEDRQRQFVIDMVRLLAAGATLTERQAGWLKILYARLRARA